MASDLDQICSEPPSEYGLDDLAMPMEELQSHAGSSPGGLVVTFAGNGNADGTRSIRTGAGKGEWGKGKGKGKGNGKGKGKGKGKGHSGKDKGRGKSKSKGGCASMLLAAALGGDSEAHTQLIHHNADLTGISMEELVTIGMELEQKLGLVRRMTIEKARKGDAGTERPTAMPQSVHSTRPGLHLRAIEYSQWDIDTLARKFHEHMPQAFAHLLLVQKEHQKYVSNRNIKQLRRLWERCVQFCTPHIALLSPLSTDQTLGVHFTERVLGPGGSGGNLAGHAEGGYPIRPGSHPGRRFYVQHVDTVGWAHAADIREGDLLYGINEYKLTDVFHGEATDLPGWLLSLAPVALHFNARPFIAELPKAGEGVTCVTATAAASASATAAATAPPSRKRRRKKKEGGPVDRGEGGTAFSVVL
jgi:hypothetical protein